MKANLTKLINDCITLGLTLADKSTTSEAATRAAKLIAVHSLPDDCDANLDDIEEHITQLKSRVSSKSTVTQAIIWKYGVDHIVMKKRSDETLSDFRKRVYATYPEVGWHIEIGEFKLIN